MKTMTFTVEDALISPMGLAVLSGAGLINHTKDNCAHVHGTIEKVVQKIENEQSVEITLEDLQEETGFSTATSFEICTSIPIYATVIGASGKAEDFLTLKVDNESESVEVKKNQNAVFKIDTTDSPGLDVEGKTVIVDFYIIMTNNSQTITIGPEDFGGYYYVEAQTLFRDENTGKDLAANITFPKIKIQSAFTFTMAASGDPSTFTFTMDAFPGYTIAKKDKKTLCDIQILSLESTSDDDKTHCLPNKHDVDTPSF